MLIVPVRAPDHLFFHALHIGLAFFTGQQALKIRPGCWRIIPPVHAKIRLIGLKILVGLVRHRRQDVVFESGCASSFPPGLCCI